MNLSASEVRAVLASFGFDPEDQGIVLELQRRAYMHWSNGGRRVRTKTGLRKLIKRLLREEREALRGGNDPAQGDEEGITGR